MAVANRTENVKWVDGLRGVASLLVVFTHLTRAFYPEAFFPADADGAAPRIVQWPIVRVLVQGRIGVPIFSLVTGYVCALKPIRQLAAGNYIGAYSGIVKSAFRRIPRLVIPASMITIGVWLLCELGAFDVAHHVASWWLIYTSPTRLPIGKAIRNLTYYLINTWVRSMNQYEANQWTLLPLLRGAFLVYMMIIATANMKPKYRMVVELGMFAYYWIAHDPEWGTQFFFGAFLCDLSQSPTYLNWISTRRWPGTLLSPILIFVGLLFASYPEDKIERAEWSSFMLKLAAYILPPKIPDVPRFYTGLGLWHIALGIQFSDVAKTFLSNKYLLWAGKNSFAVYLLHGTLLRTVLVWVLYGFTVPKPVKQADGTIKQAPYMKMGGPFQFWFWIVAWFIFQYYLASLWTNHVDPWCARLTEKLEKKVFKESNVAEVQPVASRPLMEMSVLPS